MYSMEDIFNCSFGEKEQLKTLLVDNLKKFPMEIEEVGGNLVVKKAGKGPCIMMVCSVDETGCLVTQTKENHGEVMFLGKAKPSAWLGTKMKTENGCYGILRSRKKEEKELKEEDLFLDFGIPCKENGIAANTFVHLCDDSILQKEIVFGNGASSKSALIVLLEVLKASAETDKNIIFVFLKNSQLGTFASEWIAAAYQPEYLISVSGYSADERFRVGKGTGILLKDGNAVVGEQMRRIMINEAENENIPYQIYIGKKDMQNEKMSVAGSGTRLGGICIPVEGLGEPIEKVSRTDIEKSINLLLKVLLAL